MAIREAQIAVVLLVLASAMALSAQTTNDTVAWGAERGGLRVGIAAASPTVPSERAGFVISLQNVGANDFVLNLGMMLANGR